MTKTNPDNTTSEHAKRFVVYGREECHLCQNMILALKNLQEQVSFDFQVIDIDSNPELVALYGEKIPVLVFLINHQEQEICHYFLDLAAFDDYLAKIR
jgi:thiol-disulfide isomerase/thioredoxin